MGHILTTHFTWNEKMLMRSGADDLWKEVNVSDFYEKNENNLISSMAILKNFNLIGTIEYRGEKHERQFRRTYEIFTHILNHSAIHRGQLSILLENEGIKAPNIDLINYKKKNI